MRFSTFGQTMNSAAYTVPGRSSYASPRLHAPFADSAHLAFQFDRLSRQTSEQKSSYSWPIYVSQPPVIRYKDEMVLE